MELTIRIGCCGFPVSRKKYYNTFSLVELQNTFYNLPSFQWVEKLRKEIPSGFIITMKAWQVITHPSKSPTWRRLREKPSGILENYGWLKPTNENIAAWEKVLDIAMKLNAKVIVLQTPASMPYNDESINWTKEFLKQITSITPKNIVIGWEPRGQWVNGQALNVLRSILEEYNITHIVDLFRRKPVYIHGINYVRLHGIGKGETNYKYKYTNEDLEKLYEMLIEISYRENFILFNNVYMFNDGQRFKQILIDKGINVL